MRVSDLEQLLAAAFDSSSDLTQCCSNEDDICFHPLYSHFNYHAFLGDDFFLDDKKDVFLAHHQPTFVSPLHHCYQLGNNANCFKMSQNDVHYNHHDSNNFFQGLPPPPLQFSIPPVFSHGISNNNNNNNNNNKKEEKNLSAQSLSARQRRRKISEKTKELGKLVPGGQRMNTAEMFEAASTYIKFLQAQFAILEIMETSSSSSLTPKDDEEALQCLVGSPMVQEKLYSNKKCLIPKGLVESLENHKEIQSNSQIKNDVRNFILTFC